MVTGKFKAKMKGSFDINDKNIDWLKDWVDDKGYIYGYYVDGYIVGNINEVTTEDFYVNWWIPVEPETLEAWEGK